MFILTFFCIAALLCLSIYFFSRKDKNGGSNQYFGLLLLLQASSTAIVWFINSSYVSKLPYLIHVAICLRFLWGPLLFFFVSSFVAERQLVKWKIYLHLVPTIFVFLYLYVPIFRMSVPELQLYVLHKTKIFDKFNVINLLIYCSNVSYIVASLFYIAKHRLVIQTYFANTEKIRFTWLFNLLILLVGLHFIIPIAVLFLEIQYFKYVPILYFPVLFLISYQVYKQPEVFQSLHLFQDIVQKKIAEKETNIRPSKMVEELYETLLMHINNEKSYLNSELTVKVLADELMIQPYQLSQVINQCSCKNFFDFINTYRIEEAKEKLVNIDFEHLTFEGIGYECGFNSKSSFYAVFKKYTNFTPAEYKKNKTRAMYN
jgi:AraC-like DNA-binding protein